MRMSIASTNSPSTFLSTPSMPMSAIWCWAQLDEQPAKCRRKSSPWPLGRTCSSRNSAISTARALGVDLRQAAELLAGAGLQAAREERRRRGELGDQRLGEQLVDALVRDLREQHVLLVGEPQRVVRRSRTRGRARRARTAGAASGGRPGRRGRPRECSPSACGRTPTWSSPREVRAPSGTPRRSVAPDARDELLAERLRADAVDAGT